MTISYRVTSANQIVLRDVVPGAQAQTTLTIAAGVVVPTTGSHLIDTEAAAATDNLDTITLTNHRAGDVGELTPVSAARVTTVKHGTGNITTDNGEDIVLDSLTKTVRYKVNAAGTGVVASLIGTVFADPMAFKGSIDASTNPNYPAADAGFVYKISVAGKIGGASGPNVEINDTLICNVDSSAAGDHATVGANWSILQTNIDPSLYALLASPALTGTPTVYGQEAKSFFRIIDRDLLTPPAGVEGAHYLMPATGTILGDWATAGLLNNEIAAYSGGSWRRITPAEGYTAEILDENITLRWSGAAWHKRFATFDVKIFGGAVGDGTTDDTTAIQTAITAAGSVGGGIVYFPQGTYLISASLTVSNNNVFLVGEGAGRNHSSITNTIASAATRIVWDTGVAGAPMVKFHSPAGGLPKGNGGLSKIMLDGANIATRCFDVGSWGHGTVSDFLFVRATQDNLFMGAISGALSAGPYDSQLWNFSNGWISNQNVTSNTAHAARFTGGQGNSGTDGGNTSFVRFFNVGFWANDNDAVMFESSDNIALVDCHSGFTTGSHYGLVFGSADQDSSAFGLGYARHNRIFGGQHNGIFHRAGQTGGTSSANNVCIGLALTNGAAGHTFEAPAGGSADPKLTATIHDSNGFLNPRITGLAVGNSVAQTTAARAALVSSESVRIHNGSSNHVVFDNGSQSWGLNINGATGNFRISRGSGSGIVEVNQAISTSDHYQIDGTAIVDADRLLVARSYTVATLPAGAAGKIAFASDLRVFNGAGTQEGAGVGTGGLVIHNGTAWKIAGTNVTAIA